MTLQGDPAKPQKNSGQRAFRSLGSAALAILAVILIGFLLIALGSEATFLAGLILVIAASASLLAVAFYALATGVRSSRRSKASEQATGFEANEQATSISAAPSSSAAGSPPVRSDKSGWVIAVWTTAFISLIATVVGALWLMNLGGFFFPELGLTVVIIASAVILIIGLAVTAVILKRLDLANGAHAMGLPEGSIRAIIALLLIVVFAVVATFLITNADRSSAGRAVEGVTQSELEDYPAATVFSREVVDAAACDGESPCYNLQLIRGPSPSAEMSQQLLTTLGTLVVAIAAFYFGSQSVLTAANAAGGSQVDPNAGGGSQVDPNAGGGSQGDPNAGGAPQGDPNAGGGPQGDPNVGGGSQSEPTAPPLADPNATNPPNPGVPPAPSVPRAIVPSVPALAPPAPPGPDSPPPSDPAIGTPKTR